MDTQGLRELRKRYDTTLENFNTIYGCYVNAASEIVSTMSIPILDMTAEEKELYSKLLKKSLSGKKDKNLLDIYIGNTESQQSLYALSRSGLKDENLRNIFFEQIISHLDIDKSYCILLITDTLDVKPKDSDEEWSEESLSEFTYFLCSICPIKETKAELRYMPNPEEFRGNSTGNILSSPALGFMYPAYVDRGADIYSSVYYFNKDVHEELIEGVFGVSAPKTADEQKEEFHTALRDALEEDYNIDAAAAVYSNIIAAEENETNFGIDEITEILENKKISAAKIEKLQDELGEDYSCNPENLSSKKYEIKTGETVITTEPENALRIKTREIDGHLYILVPATGGIKVNGVDIEI